MHGHEVERKELPQIAGFMQEAYAASAKNHKMKCGFTDDNDFPSMLEYQN